MKIRPITFNAAMAFLAANHRHLRHTLAGWLFGVALVDDNGEIQGIGCAARPTARMLQDGLTIELARVCTNGVPNGCSQIYGALRQAARALGYQRVITYTRADEPGISLRAAGFVSQGAAGGGECSRPSRPRKASEDPSPKVRWTWPAPAPETEAP